MSDSNCNNIVNEGDSLVNTITILGKLEHVTTSLTSTFNHLRDFFTEILQDNTLKG